MFEKVQEQKRCLTTFERSASIHNLQSFQLNNEKRGPTISESRCHSKLHDALPGPANPFSVI